jgi:hypothetical protein
VRIVAAFKTPAARERVNLFGENEMTACYKTFLELTVVQIIKKVPLVKQNATFINIVTKVNSTIF